MQFAAALPVTPGLQLVASLEAGSAAGRGAAIRRMSTAPATGTASRLGVPRSANRSAILRGCGAGLAAGGTSAERGLGAGAIGWPSWAKLNPDTLGRGGAGSSAAKPGPGGALAGTAAPPTGARAARCDAKVTGAFTAAPAEFGTAMGAGAGVLTGLGGSCWAGTCRAGTCWAGTCWEIGAFAVLTASRTGALIASRVGTGLGGAAAAVRAGVGAGAGEVSTGLSRSLRVRRGAPPGFPARPIGWPAGTKVWLALASAPRGLAYFAMRGSSSPISAARGKWPKLAAAAC